MGPLFIGGGIHSTDGLLFDGKYATMRNLGNILAGLNARVIGIEFVQFQRMAGALHQNKKMVGIISAYYGSEYGTAPYYGEIERQYWASELGYYSVYYLYSRAR